ncbi:MAG: TonB family protein [Bacteroidota bacterium]
MNRPDISRLRKNRGIYMKIGFIFSLSMVLLAFNYTTYSEPSTERTIVMEEDDLYTPVRTAHPKKRMPPPVVITPTEILSEPEPEIITEPEPEPVPSKVDVTPTTEDRPVKKVKYSPPPPLIEPPLPDDKEDIEEIFTVVEEMPRFPGCEDLTDRDERKQCASRRMLEFIYKNIKYPAMARDVGLEGNVVVRFVVSESGSISDIEVLRGIGGGCGKEVERVVNMMPDWIPGRQRNETVKVYYNLPVRFRLE